MLDAHTQGSAATPAAALHAVVLERRGRRLLDALTLAIPPTGTTAVMGPNGAGKSLTLRVLAGLIAPDAGTVSWRDSPERAAHSVALVFQKPVLLRRSVRANLMHALRIYGTARKQRRERVDELLSMAELEHLADRPARVLSGGEQQRVAMVRALAARPAFLLLDEPTASLDPHATAAIEALIVSASNAGTKAVLVTHDRGQAQRLARDVVFLHLGKMIETTPAAEFFRQPRSQEATAYLEGRLLL